MNTVEIINGSADISSDNMDEVYREVNAITDMKQLQDLQDKLQNDRNGIFNDDPNRKIISAKLHVIEERLRHFNT